MNKKNQNTDVLIIGSGVAATVIAQKILMENPKANITMLEAGSKVKMRDFAMHQHFLITGELPYDFCHDQPYPTKDFEGENENRGPTLIQMQGSRTLMYGGSTVHWGGWSFRLKPEDFQLKSNIEDKLGHLSGAYNLIDWPIGYDDLEAYYCDAERYIGVSGDSNDPNVPRSKEYPYPAFPYTLEDKPTIEAFKKLNIDYIPMPIARHGISASHSHYAPCQTTGTCKYCPFGARFAAANYLDEMLNFHDFPNFFVKTDVVVEELLMSDKHTAKGVVYVDKNICEDTKHEIHAKLVILAAGAIESTKLMLRSTSQFWHNGIANDLDLVGRNMITHPYLMWDADLGANPDGLMQEMDFPTLVSRHFDSEKEQWNGKYVMIIPPTGKGINLTQAMQSGKTLKEIKQLLYGNTKIQVNVMQEVFSQYNNRINNGCKRNHLGMIDTAVYFDQGPDFEPRLSEIHQEVEKIFSAMGANNIRFKGCHWRADHTACTTRMSDSPETGVVDKNLKVFDIDNLYICSNACFSSFGAINPTLTLTSLAMRLGDHLNANELSGSRSQLTKKQVS